MSATPHRRPAPKRRPITDLEPARPSSPNKTAAKNRGKAVTERDPHAAAAKQQPTPAQPPVGVIPPRDRDTLFALAEFLQKRRPDPKRIPELQKRIHNEVLSLSRTIDRPNFARVGRDDLVRLIHLLDEAFFEGRVLPVAKAEGLEFGFSSRMTSAAGKLVTHYPNGNRNGPRKFEMILSSTLLFQTFEDVNRPVTVTGRQCKDRLEAMQRVAEHEMTHLIEMLIWNAGNCNQKRFQSIARSFFGHTDYQHDLITQRERAATKFNIRVGDQVMFQNGSQRIVGRVNRITRRATVLVNDPKGELFSNGERYVRYYVPLEKLRLVSSK
ncbi:hypothetical protein LOC71_09420 [Rhodopirellula sp. JC740]|uniref:SprT-like family protein n=1 Tax=Rhodopirellula halodulae TaxID=2894198 RepID=A0ABS8NI72_9BACT|nr:hypothetical protein [Rhodopirellula sp. JC740]MCC9642493.1 hypothetical protein [Rhodopirellula sp. JC740]